MEVGGDIHASAALTPGERAPGIRWIGGWVSLRTGLDDMKRVNFGPHRDSNSDLSAVQSVASRYTGCSVAAHLCSEWIIIIIIKICGSTRFLDWSSTIQSF
jgi:hypothetical protein